MTETQWRALESLEQGPRFPARSFHRTYRALIRLGLVEMRLRPGVFDGHDVGFALTSEGKAELRKTEGGHS
jgi:hypothetical protein